MSRTKSTVSDVTNRRTRCTVFLWLALLLALASNGACRPADAGSPSSEAVSPGGERDNPGLEGDRIVLTPRAEADLVPGEKLVVVTTTSIIGDVVSQIGKDAISLNVLMKPGQDPHAYEPSARELAAVSTAHVIFVNGWNLEAGLLDDFENVAQNVPVMPVSAGIEPLQVGNAIDPHVWMDPHNVEQWVNNITTILSELDPKNEAVYAKNADVYGQELNDLLAYYEARVAAIPIGDRKLVTNHDSLSYFAHRYGFEVIGTIIPAADTLAEPSAGGLSDLVGKMTTADVCTIFADVTSNDQLARAAADELEACETVKVLALHTGAIGPAEGQANSYLAMMRVNINTIAEGLVHE